MCSLCFYPTIPYMLAMKFSFLKKIHGVSENPKQCGNLKVVLVIQCDLS